MTDVQQARIEAAARAMWERSPREGDPTWADLDYGIKEIWRKDAATALEAADAVLAVLDVEEIRAEALRDAAGVLIDALPESPSAAQTGRMKFAIGFLFASAANPYERKENR